MQSFKELKEELELQKFLWSELGTLYFRPKVAWEDKVLVRHLDGSLTVQLLPVYVDLYHAIVKWIEKDITMSMYALLPPIEVGLDYIKRKFYVYNVDISNYLQAEGHEHYIEPPELYEEMVEETTALFDQPMEGKDKIIQGILRRSLLEPTGKTIYDDSRLIFILVEPKITLEDLENWQSFMN